MDEQKDSVVDEQERRRIAEMQAAHESAHRNMAEFERDVAANVAANEAAGREIAEDTAFHAQLRAEQAEGQARVMADSANRARVFAADEAAAASNATFTATLVTIMLVAVVLGAIGYFAWWQPRIQAESTNVTVQPSQPTAPYVAPPPPVVTPPPVNYVPPRVNLNSPPPPIQPPATIPAPSPSDSGSAVPRTTDTSPGSDGASQRNDAPRDKDDGGMS